MIDSNSYVESGVSPINTSGSTGGGWGKLIGGLVIVVGLVAGGFYLGNNYRVVWADSWPFVPSVVQVGQAGSVVDSSLYLQVEQLMRTKYLRAETLDDQSMMFGAISGMVSSAGDPYTAFFDPEENQASEDQLSGRYSGIGAELGYDADRQIVVVAPIQGTPAEAAGIRAGDLVVGVDGTSTKGMNLQEVVGLIRGEAGTSVKLTILRPEATASQEISITRQNITIKSVELEFKEGGVAYVSLSRFGETTDSEWDEAVSQIVARGSKSMVLDLRNNPGGYLSSAIHIGSEFFRDGTVVGQRDSSGKVSNFEVSGQGRLTSIKVVVLVNGGSASASEIVAGALKSRDRAEVVGETSFGKGTVQQVVDLPYNTSLHVTIAEWVLPDGNNIDGEGIEPTTEVKLTDEDVEAKVDRQLDKALELAR